MLSHTNGRSPDTNNKSEIKIIFLRVHGKWTVGVGCGKFHEIQKFIFSPNKKARKELGTNFPSLSIFRALSEERGWWVGWGREMKISPLPSIPCRKARPGRTGNSEMGGKERECVCVGTSLNFNERKGEREGREKALRPRKGGTNGLVHYSHATMERESLRTLKNVDIPQSGIRVLCFSANI